MKFFGSVARRRSSNSLREGPSPGGVTKHSSSRTLLHSSSGSSALPPTVSLPPPPLLFPEDLPPVPVPPCCGRSTSSTLTSTSPPRGPDRGVQHHGHPAKTVTFELDREDKDRQRRPLSDASPWDSRFDNDRGDNLDDEDDGQFRVEVDRNAKKRTEDDNAPLCGTTVTFFEVDHADGDGVLYIPRRPEDELLPVAKLVVRTILENKYAKLNRTTLYDTVQKYAQAKVEIQNLRLQVRELQALLSDRDQAEAFTRGCVRLNHRRSQRKKLASEDTLRERLRLCWTKSGREPIQQGADSTSHEATTLAGRYYASPPSNTSLPWSSSPLSSSPLLSRLDALRNRRSYLESLTQDLLSVEISTAAAATTSKEGAAVSKPILPGTTNGAAVGSSKDASLSTCSSSGSEPEPDGPLLAVESELVVHRIVGTRLEV